MWNDKRKLIEKHVKKKKNQQVALKKNSEKHEAYKQKDR